MDTKNLTTYKIAIARFAGMIAGILIAVPILTQAIFVSAPQDPILTGDITSDMILNESIVNIDISKTAAIDITKLRDPSPDLFVFTNRGPMATSTLINATTSPLLLIGFGTTTPGTMLGVQGNGVFAGRLTASTIIATSTLNLKGIEYTPPSADGTLNQVLTTNGSKTLSWATPSSTRSATSTTVIIAANSLRRTQTAAYVKVKEFSIGTAGNYLVVFDLAMEAGATNCKAQVYLNDVATTTEVTVTSSTMATQTKTVYDLAVNDLIAIKTKSFDTNLGCDLQNAKIQGGFIPTVTNTLD